MSLGSLSDESSIIFLQLWPDKNPNDSCGSIWWLGYLAWTYSQYIPCICRIHPKNYADGLYCVVFCCSLLMADFTFILQGCFTCVVALHLCCFQSDAKLQFLNSIIYYVTCPRNICIPLYFAYITHLIKPCLETLCVSWYSSVCSL